MNLTRAISLDFGFKGVRANAVCQSLMHAGITEDMLKDKALVAKFMERMHSSVLPNRRTSLVSSCSSPATRRASSTA